jgi:methylenetetrahydrofolate dehydrogenase (NADP+)/methenyltetrahydrofolate cyclohydrolase
MATVIDGKAVAAKVRAEVALDVRRLQSERGVTPGLAVVRVGEDPASLVYVTNKRKACAEVGVCSWERHLPGIASQAEVLTQVQSLNDDARVHGILVQLPLPRQVEPDAVLLAIDPKKDVDGFHPFNAGSLFLGRPGPRACTPAGVMRLLSEVGFDPRGRRAVVLGRSNIVGKPMAMLLLAADATVTICHSRSQDLAGEVRRADLVIAAIGRARHVRGDWIKEGAVVVDVGMNRTPDGKLCGDVDFDGASVRASAITPVPGGVGPMTIAMLLRNTVDAARRASG